MRGDLLFYLRKCVPLQLNEVVLCSFLLTFLRRLANSALAAIFAGMSGSREGVQKTLSTDNFNSIRGLRMVHFIAGSTMRSIIRHSYTFPKSKKHKRRSACVLKKFGCIGEPNAGQPSDKSFWTSTINRKSLFFVREENLPFFVELASLLQQTEKFDGSLGHEEVMDKVVDQPTLLQKWAKIVHCELSDDEAFSFLEQTVRLFTNTYGRGVLLRRMNAASRKGKI